MPKPKIPSQKKAHENLNKRVSANATAGVSKAEENVAMKAAQLVNRLGDSVDTSGTFKFSSFPTVNQEVDNMFSDFMSDINDFIKQKQKVEFAKANAAMDKVENIVDNFYKGAKGNGHVPTKYSTSEDALKAFHDRVDANGLNISKRLWKLRGNYRTAIEDAISVAIEKGQGPVALAHRLVKYLKEYNSLNADYKEKYGTARKAKDCHYAAFRLAYTEIQMAYREAERRRWVKMDDVIGMRIRTHEKKHKEMDTCDVLAGDYPKTFKWLGWHPICHCYAIPLFRDESKSKAQQEITEVPDNFSEWVDDHAMKIRLAQAHKTLPYFLGDNTGMWQPRKATALEVATLRHDQRTPKQAAQIKAKWYKRKATLHYGENMLRVMGGIDGISTDALTKALKRGNQSAIMKACKKLHTQGKEITALKNVESPLKAARKYGVERVKKVDEIIGKMRGSLTSDLKANLKQLDQFEMMLPFVGNGKDLVGEWISKERVRIGKTIDETLSGDMDALKRMKNSQIFSRDAYSQERKDNALWDKGEGKMADAQLRPLAGKMWQNATPLQKHVVYEYTRDSDYYNSSLRGTRTPQDKKAFIRETNAITAYIKENKIPSDMWLQRGENDMGAIKKKILAAGGEVPTKLKDLVGKEMYEMGFFSTGSAKGHGMPNRPIQLNVYVPKGAQGAYVEPVSRFGHGAGMSWDGVAEQNHFSIEFETIIQRGSRFRITKVTRRGDKTYIDCELIGQKVEKLK